MRLCRQSVRYTLIGVLFLLNLVITVWAQPGPQDPGGTALMEQQKLAMPVERVSAGVFKIGDIMIKKKERTISFPAVVNMQGGLLEYLIVHTGGKTHESLLRTTVNPYHLQIAFLLLGFEGTDKPIAFQGSPETPRGEPLDITVEYKIGKSGTNKVRPEEWMVKRLRDDKREKVTNLSWIFTGSIIGDGKFLAQQEGSIAAVFHDPVAMIDNASAGGESDEIWFVDEKSVPSIGTPVTVYISSRQK